MGEHWRSKEIKIENTDDLYKIESSVSITISFENSSNILLNFIDEQFYVVRFKIIK